MKQLISRFQRTSFTPRHHALLNTPGKGAMSSVQQSHGQGLSGTGATTGTGAAGGRGPSPGGPNHAMFSNCMMQLQSASICSIGVGGVGAFSEDPCLFNQQFSSMDSLDSNIFEVLPSISMTELIRRELTFE